MSSVQQARIGNIKTMSSVPSLCCHSVYIRAVLPVESPINSTNTCVPAALPQNFCPVIVSSSQISKYPSHTEKKIISLICLPDSANIFVKLPLNIYAFGFFKETAK